MAHRLRSRAVATRVPSVVATTSSVSSSRNCRSNRTARALKRSGAPAGASRMERQRDPREQRLQPGHFHARDIAAQREHPGAGGGDGGAVLGHAAGAGGVLPGHGGVPERVERGRSRNLADGGRGRGHPGEVESRWRGRRLEAGAHVEHQLVALLQRDAEPVRSGRGVDPIPRPDEYGVPELDVERTHGRVRPAGSPERAEHRQDPVDDLLAEVGLPGEQRIDVERVAVSRPRRKPGDVVG